MKDMSGTKAESKADYPLHLFHHGVNYKAYEFFGAHEETRRGKKGVVFRVWAPRAKRVFIVGDFNEWNNETHEMKRLVDGESFEIFLEGLARYTAYKYCIETQDGRFLYKADPYAFHAETPGGASSNASKVYPLEGFEWNDKDYLKTLAHTNIYSSPINIYEVNLLSWKRHENGSFYTYSELSKTLVPYVKRMGYTHVEIMPVSEFPFDGSWGYQVTGYYAVTSRLGTPHDFMALVDAFHREGIGVILDWVPAHFPKDAFGLYEFDGAPLYEPSQPDRMENAGWGTRKFDYGRNEVLSFLVSNAVFYFEKYHVDGLRVDAVASMLYLDYGKEDGEWVANVYGGNENLEAIAFLQNLNQKIHERKDGSFSIAEESTAWPQVTGPVKEGGLDFDLKWNMGWMNDYLEYIRTDPLFRKGRHGMLTFSMIYQYSEDFMLVLSHDEVVHMKGSMFTKMPGSISDKFATLRLTYGYMAAHPGKKLIFMGQEFGQEREFSEKRELDWNLLDSVDGEMSDNERLRQYVSVLNSFYLAHPAMYELDARSAGFEWISTLDADHSVIAFLRKCKDETLLVVCNFTPVSYDEFRIGVPFAGKYKEIFNSDASEYGGTGFVNPRVKQSKRKHWDGRVNSIECRLAPLSIQIFSCTKVPSNAGRKKKER